MKAEYNSVQVQTQLSKTTKVEVKALNNRNYVEISLGSDNEPTALSSHDGQKLADAVKKAREQQIPIVCKINSTGAPPEAGVEALHEWGNGAREIAASSGVIPIIFCVQETALAGPALLLGLADFVIMIKESYSYVSGPRMVQEFTGVPVDSDALGGAAKHAQMSGLASFVTDDMEKANEIIEELVGLLPSNCSSPPAVQQTNDPVDRLLTDVADLIPDTKTGSYDMRLILEQVIDEQLLTEVRKDWATNIITAFSTINGQTVGLVANQPQSLAGTLDIAASQ